MIGSVRLGLLVLCAACSHGSDRSSPDPVPAAKLVAVTPEALCVTHGALAGAKIEVPTFRAVATGHAGDAASMKFRAHGETADTRALASGQLRRQLGLKLRADDGCNLVYVMWRLDPKPKLEVSVKRNAGQKTAKECGAAGYTKLKPDKAIAFLPFNDGKPHELRAEITGDTLAAWIDGQLAWRGELPAAARELHGPAGVRSDNIAWDLDGLEVDARDADSKCRADDEPSEP